MTKEEVIRQVESFQLDLSDDNKIYILQVHFPKDTPGCVVERTLGRLRYDISRTSGDDSLTWKFPKNMILFPATDDIYIEKLEVSKEDKLE